MSNRRRFSPRSRQMNERQVYRKYTRFDKGMFLQEDTEGIDVPDGGVSKAVNARCVGDSIEARPGTRLFTPVTMSINLSSSSTESLNTAIQSGALYAAKGSALVAGDSFIVRSIVDFSGDPLSTAKGDTVRPYDCFEITSVVSGSPAVVYMGSLRNPAVPGFGDTTTTEITASKSAYTITATSGPSFTDDLVGKYFNWGDGSRDIIEAAPTTATLRVRQSGTKASTARCIIQGRMNASMQHTSDGHIVAVFGSSVYISRRRPFCGWVRIPIIGGNTLTDSSETRVYRDDDDVIICNPSGWFRVVLSSATPLVYKFNTKVPQTLLSDISFGAGKKHKYRYTYSFSRLTGDKYWYDRMSAGRSVAIAQETASAQMNEKSIDYADAWTDRIVGDGLTTFGRLVGVELADAYKVNTGWNTIADGTFTITINSTPYQISVDFTSVETLADVAYKIQSAIRQYKDLQGVIVEFDTDHFLVSTGEGDSITSITGGVGGTSLVGALGFTDAVGTSEIFTEPVTLEYLTLPADDNNEYKDTHHITHYTVYRSQDCAEEEVNPFLCAWAADIPVAKAFRAFIAANGTLTVTKGFMTAQDDGCTLTGEDATDYDITQVGSSSAGTVDYSGSAIALASYAIGGGDVMTAYQSDKTITVVSGYAFTAADVGKPVFWSDGGISYIDSITDGATATAVWSEGHGGASDYEAATINPTRRRFTDTLRDDALASMFSTYPLYNRYQQPYPDGNVSAVAPGFICTGRRGDKHFVYGDIQYRWLMGYYNPSFQKTEDIWGGLQDLAGANGFIYIRDSLNTYKQSITDFTNVGEISVGESVSKLPPMTLVSQHGSVGAGGRQSIDNGVDILITSEPAVRTFNGSEYSENYAAKRIQRSELVHFKRVYVTGFNNQVGFFIWGIQER